MKDFEKLTLLHIKNNIIGTGIIGKDEQIIALDLSTKAGICLISNINGNLEFQAMRISAPVEEYADAKYPLNMYLRAEHIATEIYELTYANGLTDLNCKLVIEETNGSKSRYAQKMLEFIHCKVIDKFFQSNIPIIYINSSDWRRVLGLQLTKEQKKQNAFLSKKLRDGKTKKEIGIKGKITKKHLALNFVNGIFKENFKVKDNDVAEAICLGIAYHKDITKYGLEYCNGK